MYTLTQPCTNDMVWLCKWKEKKAGFFSKVAVATVRATLNYNMFESLTYFVRATSTERGKSDNFQFKPRDAVIF